MQAIETLELRLTDEQIAAIRQRIARRKRQIGGCGQADLGEINGRVPKASSARCEQNWRDQINVRRLKSERRSRTGDYFLRN
jgi:hypothetical protein